MIEYLFGVILHRFHYLTLVLLTFIFDSTLCYAKEYNIVTNKEPFELQLKRILEEANILPEYEDIIIHVASGYYEITKTVELKTTTHRIIIEGHKDEPTIIAGSVLVKGWIVLENGLWMAHVPDLGKKDYILDQLYVNGQRATRSRTPNDGTFIVRETTFGVERWGAILCEKEDTDFKWGCDKDIPIISIFRKWAVSKRYLKEKKGEVLYFSGKAFNKNNPLTKGNGVVVENTKADIDMPGEWCVDKNGDIYYLPRDGETIKNTEFRIPIIEKLFYVHGGKNSKQGVAFKNMVFEHTSYQLPQEGSEYDQAASGMSAAIEVDNITNFTFEDCEVRNIANNGLWLRYNCKKSKVERNNFHDLGAGAIKISSSSRIPEHWASHITVANNIINHYGQLMESAVGIILFNASDCIINHNDIHYGNYTGISLGWTWGYEDSPSKRNVVAYNRISHIGDGRLNDLGGVYTLGKSEGTHIHHNVIHDITSGDFRGWGIYADEGTSGVLIDNNIVYRTKSGGFHQNYGEGNSVKNNIFAWGELSQIAVTSAMGAKPLTVKNNIFIMENGMLMTGEGIENNNFDVGKNCYWSTTIDQPYVGKKKLHSWIAQKDTTSIIEDPKFVNPKNGDFRIRNMALCKKIDFVPIDCSKAGVYGKRKRKTLANNISE